MIAYSYSPEDMTYFGETTSQEDQANPGTYLCPYSATHIEPPTTGADEVAVWNGVSWDIVTDNRGTWYDKTTAEPYEIEDVGVLPDPNWTDVEPPIDSYLYEFVDPVWERTLARAKWDKTQEIMLAYGAANTLPITSGGHDYVPNLPFFTYLVGAIEIVSGAQQVGMYDVDHNTYTLAVAAARDVAEDILAAVYTNTERREDRLKEIGDAADIATVDGIVW